MIDKILLGRIIKHARLMSGNGLRAFANAIGIVPSRLNEIERGESFAADEELQSISDEIERTWQAGIAWRERIVNERDSLESELASLREQLKAAERERDEAKPFMVAVKNAHNGYDATAREQLHDLHEPATPEQAIEELVQEASELAAYDLSDLEVKLAAAERENARYREEIMAFKRTYDDPSWMAINAGYVREMLKSLLAQPEEAKDGDN